MSHTELTPEIRSIQERLRKVAASNHTEKLLQIIERTGWTDTQAHLVRVVLDSVVHQLEGIEQVQKALVKAADEIGKVKAAG